jgi:hypothetical protein
MSNPSKRAVARGAGGWTMFIVVLLDITWAASLSTQFVAARLGYHRHLGDALFRASAATRVWLEAAVVLCIVAGVLCLLGRRWWAGLIPLLLLAVTAFVIRDGPVYAPTRVFVWHAAYRRIPGYEHLFTMAWAVLAAAAIALWTTSWRLLRTGSGTASGRDTATPRDFSPMNTINGQSKRVAPIFAPAPRLRTAGRRRTPVR